MEIWTIFRQLGRRLAPERREEIFHPHGAIGVEQQIREEAALPGTSEPERKAVPAHFERAEQAVLEPVGVTRHLPAGSRAPLERDSLEPSGGGS